MSHLPNQESKHSGESLKVRAIIRMIFVKAVPGFVADFAWIGENNSRLFRLLVESWCPYAKPHIKFLNRSGGSSGTYRETRA